MHGDKLIGGMYDTGDDSLVIVTLVESSPLLPWPLRLSLRRR